LITQFVILSGKGGTGKTSVAAAFAHLARAGPARRRAVLADADVDAANLDLLLRPSAQETHEFMGGAIAAIEPAACDGCGICARVCRFDAIIAGTEHAPYRVDPLACDGCAACAYQCPRQAIRMEPETAGRWFRSESRYGPLFHAALRPAGENSGKLVTLVRQRAQAWAAAGGYDLVLVDGPPGIGCPVIAAASGMHLALVVTEPSLAGAHDMQRVLNTLAHFRVPALVCINKADINLGFTAQIEDACRQRGVPCVGRIPFDPTATEALLQGEPVTAYRPDALASLALADIWQNAVWPRLATGSAASC
jgi:MinD superfamily P-loop ATPase